MEHNHLISQFSAHAFQSLLTNNHLQQHSTGKTADPTAFMDYYTVGMSRVVTQLNIFITLFKSVYKYFACMCVYALCVC